MSIFAHYCHQCVSSGSEKFMYGTISYKYCVEMLNCHQFTINCGSLSNKKIKSQSWHSHQKPSSSSPSSSLQFTSLTSPQLVLIQTWIFSVATTFSAFAWRTVLSARKCLEISSRENAVRIHVWNLREKSSLIVRIWVRKRVFKVNFEKNLNLLKS